MLSYPKFKILSLIFPLAVWTLFLPLPAQGADLDLLSQNAEVILFGQAMETQCHWAESSLNILSHTTFHAEKCIKGSIAPGETVIIESFGGKINGMKQRVPNAPVFISGEYALVFLVPVRKGVYRVYRDQEGLIPFVNRGGNRTTQDGRGVANLIKDVNLVLGK